MIWAVEGNVNVGKTTFIKKFADKNKIPIIEETTFPADMQPIDRQLYYINNEIKKYKEFFNKSCIMDRTILSVYIYTLISNEFEYKEKSKLVDKMNKLVNSNNIFIPDKLFFILYPFELINKSHNLLGKEKKTQNSLVDYKYYLKYNLFFSNMLKDKKVEIIETKENRQYILTKCDFIYHNLKKNLPVNDSVVLLDGAPAIGKTSIGKKQSTHKYIEEFKYKKYTLANYENQIESIITRIKCLSNGNVILDTSFLMGITHLFYSHNRKVSQDEKLIIINKIVKKIPMYLYISKIIYLYADEKTLLSRKESDKNKKRKHFNDNIKYLKDEINFYKKLDKRMEKFSNIYMIKADKSIKEIIDTINILENKEVLLVDLFYYILDCIKRGEI